METFIQLKHSQCLYLLRDQSLKDLSVTLFQCT